MSDREMPLDEAYGWFALWETNGLSANPDDAEEREAVRVLHAEYDRLRALAETLSGLLRGMARRHGVLRRAYNLASVDPWENSDYCAKATAASPCGPALRWSGLCVECQRDENRDLRAEVGRLRALALEAGEALRAVGKAALVVRPTLDKPYPDDPSQTPWSRFMEAPARNAYNLGSRIRRQLGAGGSAPHQGATTDAPELLDTDLSRHIYSAPDQLGHESPRGVILRHAPTGIEAACHSERSGLQNTALAYRELRELVARALLGAGETTPTTPETNDHA